MSNLLELKDQRFGKLVVKEQSTSCKNGNARWLCNCDCGREKIVQGVYLKRGITVSCGKCDYEDFTGKKIGKLKVIQRAKDKIVNGQPIIHWECQCECGEKVIRVSAHLRRGNCTCLNCKKEYDKINNFRGCGEMSGIFWSNVKRTATIRGREFSISKEYAWDLFLKQNRKCAISGLDLVFAPNKKGQQTGLTTASIDRIDSKKGYLEGNIQWTHKWINVMKSDFATEEFLDFCKTIVKYQKEKHE